ncbi:MAG: glycosyltransferase family 4 protein [Chloroflexi bacterium]|nr:MAG: glycosyltransferase family 4 protein [Chloroflexota bacterium]
MEDGRRCSGVGRRPSPLRPPGLDGRPRHPAQLDHRLDHPPIGPPAGAFGDGGPCAARLFPGTRATARTAPASAPRWVSTRSARGGRAVPAAPRPGWAWVVVLGEVPPGLSGQRLIRAAALPEGELRAALSGAVAAVDADPRAGNASAVLEAMACGAPAVVAPGSAGAEVIGSAGILVSPQDASGWAAALAFLAGNREERNRMAARALRAAAQFRAADAARRLLEALTEAARADRRAAGAG